MVQNIQDKFVTYRCSLGIVAVFVGDYIRNVNIPFKHLIRLRHHMNHVQFNFLSVFAVVELLLQIESAIDEVIDGVHHGLVHFLAFVEGLHRLNITD